MPLIKSKRLLDKRAAERDAIRKMYQTNQYSMRDLAEHFHRSLKYVFLSLKAKR